MDTDMYIITKLLYEGITSYINTLTMINRTISNKIVLDKQNRKVFQVKEPPILPSKESVYQSCQCKNKLFEEKIDFFVKTLQENLSSENLQMMMHNLQTLNIEKKSFLILNVFDPGLLGYYSSKSNKIVVKDFGKRNNEDDNSIDFSDITIYHELMHMASSVIINESKKYSGFRQLVGIKSIGTGINEGFTEYLTEQFFDNNLMYNSSYSAYRMEVYITKIIIDLIGEERMRNLYFSANLKGLIESLAKFSSEEEAKKFIINLDILNNKPATVESDKIMEMYNKAANDIQIFLKKAFMKKWELDDKELTPDYLNFTQDTTQALRHTTLKSIDLINFMIPTSRIRDYIHNDTYKIITRLPINFKGIQRITKRTEIARTPREAISLMADRRKGKRLVKSSRSSGYVGIVFLLFISILLLMVFIFVGIKELIIK